MGNIVRVFDGDGNQVACGDHDLACAALVSFIGERLTGEPMPVLIPQNVNAFQVWFDDALGKASDPEGIILQIFMCDEVELARDDLDNFDEAIRIYPPSFQDGPKSILKKYRSLLDKYGTIRLEYSGDVYSALTITSQGINPDSPS